MDQYPYSASSTNLSVLLPSWALAGGQEEVKKRLADVSTRKRIAAEMKQTIQRRNGRNRLDYAVVTRCTWDSARERKSISQITREKGRKAKLEEEIQTVLEMMEQGGAGMLYHSMDEPDVERILRFPHSMVASTAVSAHSALACPTRAATAPTHECLDVTCAKGRRCGWKKRFGK